MAASSGGRSGGGSNVGGGRLPFAASPSVWMPAPCTAPCVAPTCFARSHLQALASAAKQQQRQHEQPRPRALAVCDAQAQLCGHARVAAAHPAVAGLQLPAADAGEAQHAADPRRGGQGEWMGGGQGAVRLQLLCAGYGCEDGTEAVRHPTLRRQHLQMSQLLHKAACHPLPSALTSAHATLSCLVPCSCAPLQVRHMVLVETDAQRAARLAAEAAAAAPRPPVRVRH